MIALVVATSRRGTAAADHAERSDGKISLVPDEAQIANGSLTGDASHMSQIAATASTHSIAPLCPQR